MAIVLCPHCQYKFDYPTPQDIPAQGNEIIKLTTCPICEKPIKVRFELSRDVDISRGSAQGQLTITSQQIIKADKGD